MPCARVEFKYSLLKTRTLAFFIIEILANISAYDLVRFFGIHVTCNGIFWGFFSNVNFIIFFINKNIE